ncbi:MAG: hypothetical protein M0P95_17925 [Sulfuritalea sp.]|jgi:hypothetical protein|nr:hypothetical protein [Sulfuritalea sp.]
MKYTVLLLLPDYAADNYGQDTCLSHVDARTVEDAVIRAQDEASNNGHTAAADDFHPLLVLRGHHDDIKP